MSNIKHSINIVGKDSYEDYYEEVIFDGEVIGNSNNLIKLLDNLLRRLKLSDHSFELFESKQLQNGEKYVAGRYRFDNSYAVGSFIVFSNGLIGFIIDNQWVEIHFPIKNGLPEELDLQELEHTQTGVAARESN